jgi:hypothetical protein
MLSLIRSYFDSTSPQVSVPSDVESAVPSDAEPLPTTDPLLSASSHLLQTILDKLLLDTRIQRRYDLTIETSTESPNNNNYIRIYPQRHVNNRDRTVYNPYAFDDPIDLFFKITIKSNLQTCMFPSKHTLRVDVFSIEKNSTDFGMSFSNELYPWISREPNHTQTISLDDPVTVDIIAIESYIQQTYVNINHKILNAIPEVLDVTRHYCANCRCKLQVNGSGWKHRNY